MEAGETSLQGQQLTMETTRTMKLALNKEWVLGVRIGGGGFGAVFAAENAAGEQAAVKLVRKEPGTDREMLLPTWTVSVTSCPSSTAVSTKTSGRW